MPAGGHSYFAYGSNLCVRQMAQRCPDATDPRPAVLTDHDWLINQRGVATVEPFAGNQVHGVLWQLSDHDLADAGQRRGRSGALPARPADRAHRQRAVTGLGLHRPPGDPGSAPARLPVADHRRRRAARASATLDRILAALGSRALASPGVCEVAFGPAPQSLSELLSEPGVNEISQLRSRFGFLAIHGGGLEQMTDVIAERAAEAADASVYLLRHPDRYPHHLPSARFYPGESPRLAEFLDHVDVAVSLHGYGRIGRSTQLLAGGRNRALADHLARHIQLTGYQVVTDLDEIPRELRGLHPDNPVNRVRDGGTQLELSVRVRGLSPRSPLPGADGLSPVTSALVQGLAAAARSW